MDYQEGRASRYAVCGCHRPRHFRWDYHELCYQHGTRSHFLQAKSDFEANREPRCPDCRRLTRQLRLRWLGEYANYWDLPEFSEFPAQGLWWQNYDARLPPVSFGGPPPLPANTSHASEASLASYPATAVAQAGAGQANYSASAVAHTGWQASAGLPGNEGHMEEVLPPSGVVADNSAQRSRYVEPPPVQDEDECEEDDVMDQEDAPDQPHQRMQARLTSLFKKAVSVCGVPTTATASSNPLLPIDCFQLAEQKGTKDWDALPSVAGWYKAAEKHSIFKGAGSKKAGEGMGVCLLDVKVEGLTPASWDCPHVEPALLAHKDRPRKGGFATLHKHPHSKCEEYARESWFACLRTVGMASCAGFITSYINALSSADNEERHYAALQAAGVDLDTATPLLGDPGVQAYVNELEECTHVLAALLCNMSLQLGQANAANTLVRRAAWLDQVCAAKAKQDEYFLNPTPGNSGLLGCTPEAIKKMREDALERETLHKELGIPPPPPPPQSAGRGRGGANTTRGGGLGALYAKRGFGQRGGRGGGKPPRGRYSKAKAKGGAAAQTPSDSNAADPPPTKK